MPPLVAIIGRPNVGKSALFNRLVEKRHAIVSEVFGTTRDVLSGTITVKKKLIEVVDTAGLTMTLNEKDPLQLPVQQQAREALSQADLILFCVDGTVPLTKDDQELAKILRSSDKNFLFVVTKIDNPKLELVATEVYQLGFRDPIFISSLHNLGIERLKERIHTELKESGAFPKGEKKEPKTSGTGIAFCLVGKPNVGKSSLFNAILKKSKAVVSEVPGTTRDTVDSELHYGDVIFKVIDTAGLKRPGRVEQGIEKYSALRTMRAISRSDVCVFVLDGQEKISHMDQAVTRYILEEKKGLVVVVNKWDLLQQKENGVASSGKVKSDLMDRFLTYLQDHFKYLAWAPVLFVSAKTGQNTGAILDRVYEIYQERVKRIETGRFNRFVEEVVGKRFPTGTKKIVPKILYATQVDISPPHFLLFVNEKEAFHFSWMRFFENQLREKFGFAGTPLVVELRNREREKRRKK